ncbi:39S ribosomal protein L1, mitochondrial [Diprion similis]|uniref:39S ribosomal protein L1, mitochondrial n=1 Tax=Diprion similis TaxID=362088 RepID=UPI001EF80261|nr:39S ribosomal protein L1, mitochondrial [Diprion similis]
MIYTVAPSKMAVTNGGRLFAGICTAYVRGVIGCLTTPSISIQMRGYAARPGTRSKARQTKAKQEVKKASNVIPPHMRKSNKGPPRSRRIPDMNKTPPVDDVWVAKYHLLRLFPLTEAIQCHKETHHPTTLDSLDSALIVHLELDMKGVKKTKFIEKFNGTLHMPYQFRLEEDRTILALCKGEAIQREATEAGATLVGGSEIIKQILTGTISLSDYTTLVAHPNILPELTALRGLLKKRFPSIKDGNLNPDIAVAVRRFKEGVMYNAVKDNVEPDFGTIDTPIGTLEMDTKQLEENFSALVTDIEKRNPVSAHSFITKAFLICPPYPERLKVDFERYIVKSIVDNTADESDDEQSNTATASN